MSLFLRASSCCKLRKRMKDKALHLSLKDLEITKKAQLKLKDQIAVSKEMMGVFRKEMLIRMVPLLNSSKFKVYNSHQ